MIHGNRECERWALFMAAAMASSVRNDRAPLAARDTEVAGRAADKACNEYDKRFSVNGDKRCQNIARNGEQCTGCINHKKPEPDWEYYEQMCDGS